MLFRNVERVWIAQAPAKVNLGLRVLSRRPDGYHELDTVIARISLCDTLIVEVDSSPQLFLHVRRSYPHALRSEQIPETSENLVLRAAELLRRRSGQLFGARMTLIKRIPSAAGLGGGSSDAATTLATLNRAWGLNYPRDELLRLAAELGSDVPFFLANTVFARCTGRGELVQPLSTRIRLWLVVAKLSGGLSTAAVYRGCQPTGGRASLEPMLLALQRGDVPAVARLLRNDLQNSAEKLSDDILSLKAEFSQLSVWGHQLTGSGSAYFGICRSQRQAWECSVKLKSRGLSAVWSVSTCA